MKRALSNVVVPTIAAAAIIGWIIGARAGPADCVLRAESEHVLDPGQPEDAAHLERDFDRVRAVATRYRDYVATLPILSDSIAARRGGATRPERAARYCIAILSEEIARTHHLDPRGVVAAITMSSRIDDLAR